MGAMACSSCGCPAWVAVLVLRLPQHERLAAGAAGGPWPDGGCRALLVLLARRLPPGLLRGLAAFVPDCVTTIRRLRRDPRVPPRPKIAVALAGLWLLSPIDLLPEFLPVLGPLDDVLVVALALRYAARQVPHEVLAAAWPGEPRLLERLLGSPDPASS
jgi:uncharacterized membrane protein YkvA (DUF1232 family)